MMVHQCRSCLWGVLLAVLLWLGNPYLLLAKEVPEAFEPAQEGMVRYVLWLTPEEDESSLKVELIVGQDLEVDSVNSYRLGGTIERETIAGWGYTYYQVERVGPMMGTLMAVGPEAEKEQRFIAIGGEPYLIRYNSRLPVVIYVPDQTQVRYRIWRADGEGEPVERN